MLPLFFKKLATIGVSEFILVFLLILTLGGVFALSSSNVNLKLSILPPPPPTITSIFGDPQIRAVLVIGSSTLPNSVVRVYVFSQPMLVEATADANGAFLVAFTAEVLPPGAHEFTATTVLNENQSTDPSPRVAVQVNDNYTIESIAGSAVPTVKIGNADPATSELLRTIIRNQEAAKQPNPSELPKKNTDANQIRLIMFGLLAVIIIETVLLLFERARRKKKDGKNFFHLGRGFYRLPPPRISTEHPPAQ
jgi:hypothetical protein